VGERLTDAQNTAIVAHFSYELEPITPLPDWNAVAMETVYLRNEITALRAAPDAAEARAVGVMVLDQWGVRELARVSGVSHATVSRVKRGLPCDSATMAALSKAVGKCLCCGAALHPASPLGAVVMREKAADVCDEGNVGKFWGNAIRAIPLPTDAELLAAAAELPEVRALVDAGEVMANALRGSYIVPGSATAWAAAIAPFARNGGQ